MIMKFYDAAVEEGQGGGSGSAVVEQAPSIAALMAKQGVNNNGSEMVAKPISIDKTEGGKETAQQVETPAATATEETKVVETKKETPNAEEVKVEVPTPQKEEEQKPVPTWQEALKGQQPEAVLKSLGFDDEKVAFINGLKELDPKMVNLLRTWQEKGDVKEYLKELSTDYSTMPSEDVMRHQLRKEYPKASDSQIELLYRKEVVEKYNLDSIDEDELAEGRLLLDAKSEKFRDEFIKNQEKFLIPEPPEKPNGAAIDPEIEERRAMVERVTEQFHNDPYTKEVLSKNVISIGEGEDKFSFPIDGKAIADLVMNGDETGELMFDKQKDAGGNEVLVPKSKHQILVAAVNKYGEKLITELAKHYKSIGGKAAIEPIDNAKPNNTNNTSTAEQEPKTPAEWMAKKGYLSSGGQ